MDTLIFAFGSVVTLVVGVGLTLGIISNNRMVEPGSGSGEPTSTD